MKKYFILSTKLFLIVFLFSSCNSGDDNSGTPDDGFIVPISQILWEDTAGTTKTYSFQNPDSVGHFIGHENEGAIQNSLSGKTKSFDISFTVIKVQNGNHVDYAGKITDTLATHKRMVLYSNIDTLYLRPQ
ncbi:MAG: hypothetical protein ABI723_07630 [Bacteroidia bacterium]